MVLLVPKLEEKVFSISFPYLEYSNDNEEKKSRI